MPGPRLDLSPKARQALPYIESGLARGLSGNAIQRELSLAGIGLRRTDLQEAIRGLRGAELAADRLKFVRPDRRVDPSRLAPAITRQLREYSFRVRIEGVNAVTGETERRYVNVSTDRLLTAEDIDSIAASYVIQDAEDLPSASPGFEVESVNLVSATRA